ncbi:hypothetical protein KI809_12425 [Geobacter pelophilus]|uniref:Uncharacterized protein n=1 Tax=Geoanaerobacter pelophilus TaxID=60036 RepID=A0AAW4L202_9BACT|nr:hypothetical protein [Geoanaerobacter pelophilus]MBT0665104.1 hypothetical protein [Geoanaerobacter pelophilus]
MDCTCDNHATHICQLKATGLTAELQRVTDNPTVTCRHCGAQANSAQYVCAAHLGTDAPNVEGGHGSVGLDEVGKPHAGASGDKEDAPEIPIKQVPGDGICGGY